MIRRDYIMRMISEMLRVLLDLIFRSKDFSPARKIEIFDQVYDLVGMKKKEILAAGTDELIKHLDQSGLALDKLELIALTLLSESQSLEEDTEEKQHLKTRSLELLKYIDLNSNCFSLERRNIIDDLEIQINFSE